MNAYDSIEVVELSHSSRSILRNGCPRKYELIKFHGPRRADYGVASEIGQAMHRGLQEFMRTRDMEAAIWAMLQEYPWQWLEGPLNKYSFESCLNVLSMAARHEVLHEHEIATVNVNGESRPAIEVPFSIIIKNFEVQPGRFVNVNYRGFIDLILFDRVNEKYIVWDIKTSARNISDITAMYKFDEQCLPYALVLETALGKPIRELDVGYLHLHMDFHEPRVEPRIFQKNEIDIQNWLRGFLFDLQALKVYLHTGWFPREAKSCTAYNKVCGYFDVCHVENHETLHKILTLGVEKQPHHLDDFKPWFTTELEIPT